MERLTERIDNVPDGKSGVLVKQHDYASAAENLIEEYRAIGTLEELKAAMKYVYLAKRHGTVGQVIENCVKYEEIGTPEEFQEAMEKNSKIQ